MMCRLHEKKTSQQKVIDMDLEEILDLLTLDQKLFASNASCPSSEGGKIIRKVWFTSLCRPASPESSLMTGLGETAVCIWWSLYSTLLGWTLFLSVSCKWIAPQLLVISAIAVLVSCGVMGAPESTIASFASTLVFKSLSTLWLWEHNIMHSSSKSKSKALSSFMSWALISVPGELWWLSGFSFEFKEHRSGIFVLQFFRLYRCRALCFTQSLHLIPKFLKPLSYRRNSTFTLFVSYVWLIFWVFKNSITRQSIICSITLLFGWCLCFQWYVTWDFWPFCLHVWKSLQSAFTRRHAWCAFGSLKAVWLGFRAAVLKAPTVFDWAFL